MIIKIVKDEGIYYSQLLKFDLNPDLQSFSLNLYLLQLNFKLFIKTGKSFKVFFKHIYKN